jgi:hypothetical protein
MQFVTVCGERLAGFQIGRKRINEGGPLWLFHTAVFCQPGIDAEVKKQVRARIDPIVSLVASEKNTPGRTLI